MTLEEDVAERSYNILRSLLNLIPYNRDKVFIVCKTKTGCEIYIPTLNSYKTQDNKIHIKTNEDLETEKIHWQTLMDNSKI